MTYELVEEHEQAELLRQLPGWSVVDGRLVGSYRFADFRQALAFTVQIGCLAEQLNHHPDLTLSWGKVGISLWTHDKDALTRHDFRLAARIHTISLAPLRGGPPRR